MTWVEVGAWITLWLLVALGYIRVARRFAIVDLPNHRSSHERVTLRGGGIIFWLGLMLATVWFDYFTLPLTIAIGLLGVTSFVDDLISMPAFLRLVLQITAIAVLFMFDASIAVGLDRHWLIVAVVFVVMLGFLNIYNFMDGINGLSVAYTLLGLLSLSFYDPQRAEGYYFMVFPLIAMAIFNVRPKGKAIFFSGDIGSITAGFTLIYFIVVLCIQEETLCYLSLIMVYLVDGGWIIIIRLYKKERIWQAHRSHLYQLMANELGWGHLKVTTIYVGLQLIINILMYIALKRLMVHPEIWLITLFLIVTTFYFITRHYVNLKVETSEHSSPL